MKKHTKEIALILIVIVCATIALKCISTVIIQQNISESESEIPTAAETVTEALKTETLSEIESLSKAVTTTASEIMSSALSERTNPANRSNDEVFYEYAEEQGISRREADKYWNMLLADNIFKDDTMRITGLVIDDMDHNGINDLLVMVLNREDWVYYGTGCVWFYMNDDKPYCFASEEFSYYGYFDFFAEDIDNDNNTELVLSAQGTGCGATGDFCKAVFRYKDHDIEQMELPSDLEVDYDQGIYVSVYQEADKNLYSAYCSYFDEELLFESENIYETHEPRFVGGNVRGFYDLRPVKYQGKNALQASEYLCGEGGNVHNVATANFIILWDKEGRGYVDRWWIETSENTYANNKGCRITYADGCYYYASQLDHYYLYRANEDGREAVCLAKVHPGAIQVDGDVVYFVNLSDHNAIYRIGTDGSGMAKLCDSSDNHMQLTEEYIYFLSTYDKTCDIRGLVSIAPDKTEYYDPDDYLYRIRKDGSGKELILTDVDDYVLASEIHNSVTYEGNIYCSRLQRNKTTDQLETIVTVYDLDGNSKDESYQFDFWGTILVCRDQIYCAAYGEPGKICMYTTWKGSKEMTTLPNQLLTDYCIYKGTLYGLKEDVKQEKRTTQIYSFSSDANKWHMIYNNNTICTALDGDYNNGKLVDLYATKQGVFLRQFASSEDGIRWFAVGDNKHITIWEDETQIPITQPAVEMEYTGEWYSIKSDFHSTDGYEDYLSEDLTYQTFHAKDESGNGYWPYTICLPQFNDKIAGYRKINKYFQDAYQESLGTLQTEFVELLEEEKELDYPSRLLSEGTSYDYIYIDEKYITVAMFQHGYWGGIRSWTTEKPVTFERDTGKIVSLCDIYGIPTDEVVSYATAAIYKYMESIGRRGGTEPFFLQDEDVLTEQFDPEQFFLFPEGVGLYYPIYAIDCGAAGDYVFIIPYTDN
ncbi:MAG: DUF5050 domain-containing protein [Lachnospiraceae bacterium]|nr:DUF5050 domain-containing protein [Lachnospiraceae bacterium]